MHLLLKRLTCLTFGSAIKKTALLKATIHILQHTHTHVHNTISA